MDKAITLGGLLHTFLIGGGFIIMVAGAAWVFGAGMSSNPQAASEEGKKGCTVAAVGLVIMAIAIWSALS